MITRLRPALCACALLMPASLSAEADGPDFFRVTGVSDGGALNIRAGAGVSHARLGQIPADGDGIRNLGCTGGLSYADWVEASATEQAAAARNRWCKIRYRGVEGWVAGRYLVEAEGPQAEIAPGPDCAEGDSSARKAVCANPTLARLDGELNRLYWLAMDGPDMTDDRRARLRAEQQGWSEGRDACGTSETGLSTCIAAEYAMRIDAIRTNHAGARVADAEGISAGPYVYVCEGLGAALSMVSVQSDPPILSLRWGETWVAPMAQPAASGSKYRAETLSGRVQFWIKGDEALLMRADQPVLVCQRDQAG